MAWTREAAAGHSEYPRPFQIDNRDVLRTTGYNTAVVVAGLPELAVPKERAVRVTKDQLVESDRLDGRCHRDAHSRGLHRLLCLAGERTVT